MGEKDTRTRNRECCFTENRTTISRHRTTMECAEKVIFATGKIVLRFPSIVLRWNANRPTETDQFSPKKPNFQSPKPQIELQQCLQVLFATQQPKQLRIKSQKHHQ